MNIKKIDSYEILASGGYPTIECRVELEDGTHGVASVPYGASAGSKEATVKMDGDMKRYNGKGMLSVAATINQKIAPMLIGLNSESQIEIDQRMISMDNTENKSSLGGNAILAVSVAVANASANYKKLDLYQHIVDIYSLPKVDTIPKPMVVVIEGGKHAHSTTDLQEFCISGIGDDSSTESIRKALESYHQLKKILEKEGLSTNVGNEGAFAPNGIISNTAPFDYIIESIDKAGFIAGKELAISIDAAASEFYKDGYYELELEGERFTGKELTQFYKKWIAKYPIATLEDMHSEFDWESWPEFNKICRENSISLIGDDLTVTNKKILQTAIDKDAISGILIKLNQIGSLTETIETCILAKKHNISSVTSHRGGGETNDSTMVDVAVAVGSTHIKVGPTRGERVSKYNRLMQIERHIN